jgi:L-alanine-DL-glutamate epimerase-like enolase superfamily enzyme
VATAVGTIAAVRAATARVPMPVPARVGDHVIAEREYALVRVVDTDEREGFAYALTRGAPLATIVDGLVAPRYVGAAATSLPDLAESVLRSNPTVLCAGSGMRALSLVDMACWDLLARAGGGSVAGVLGGDDLAPLPALLVVGFPPSSPLAAVGEEAVAMYRAGWRTFKLARGADLASTRVRLEAAAAAGPDVRLVLDAAWTWRDVDDAMVWVDALADLPFAWIEDPFPPGGADKLAALRTRMPMPLGAGDEVGGPFFPDAFVDHASVDVLRLDATAVCGVSGFRAAARLAARAGLTISCHVHGLLHAQLLRGLGLTGWVEFGRPNSGVDPLGDALVPDVVQGNVPAGALATAEPPLGGARLRAVACADVDTVLEALGVSA